MAGLASGWTCQNHLLIAEEAGLSRIDACASDTRRDFSHIVRNSKNHIVVPADFEGGLASEELYHRIYELSWKLFNGERLGEKEKQDLVHYVGEISNPMHNVIFRGFNKKHHALYDSPEITSACISRHRWHITTHADFVARVAATAEAARMTGYEDMEDGVMDFNEATACAFASESVALLRSIRKKLIY